MIIPPVTVGAQVVSPMSGDEFRVNETTDISITCVVVGHPAPVISFLRGSSQFGSIQNSVILGDGTYEVRAILTLTNVTDGDTGNVTCQAVNTVAELSQTRMDTATVNLIVNGE